MILDLLQLVKFCHYSMYFLSFFGLLFPCYVFYMYDAIQESENGAMTVTKRSEPREYEPPSFIFCPMPSFRPSVSEKYNLSIAPIDIFRYHNWLDSESLEKKLFYNRNVQELYEEFQYGDILTFNFKGVYLKFGKNKIFEGTIEVELKIISTLFNGDCYVIEFNDNWKGEKGYLFVGYRQNLEIGDTPRGFVIYLTQRNSWQSIATNTWEENEIPMKIDTMSYNFPVSVNIVPLSRKYYYPLPPKNRYIENLRNFTQNECIKSEMIKAIHNEQMASNCTKLCIPAVFFNAFFNVSEVKICSNFDEHFCGNIWKIGNLVGEKINFCKKQMKIEKSAEKSFTGWAKFRNGAITFFLPEMISKEQEKRTLIYLYWKYQSNMTTILEENLVYSSKDLLAWLGGAFGIFVGYSFFDLAKHIIDIVFHFIDKAVRTY